MHDEKTGAAGDSGVTVSADGGRVMDCRALRPGSRIENIEIVDLIGSGRSGFVYLAYDRTLSAHVALREYMPRAIAMRGAGNTMQPANAEQAALFDAGLKSFASEALVLARIDSPSLVKVLRYWEGNGGGYAVMPFYDGVRLRQAVSEHRIAVNEVRLRAVLGQLLDAVEAVHRAQSCHGNISPSEILLRADGRPLLLDFDAAGRLLAEISQTQSAIARPGFTPLEQYAEHADLESGAWSDIYALGAVAYFLITGKTPPTAPERARNDTLWPVREAGRGSYSETLLNAVERALAVNPQQRPQSAAEMRALLGAFSTGAGGFAPRATHARDAIRADREAHVTQGDGATAHAIPPTMAATRTAHDTASAPMGPVPPVMPETHIRPLPEATFSAPPARVVQQPMHMPPPITGEWRKQPMVAGHRDYPSPRRRRRPALLMSVLVLIAGAGAGLVVGYQMMNGPDAGQPAPMAVPAIEDTPPVAQAEPVPPQREATPTADREETPRPAAEAKEALRPPSPGPSAAAPITKPAAPPVTAPAPTVPPVASAAPTAKKTPLPADKPKAPETSAANPAEQEEWRVASALGESWGYENYLKRYPDGPNATAARQRLEALRTWTGQQLGAAPDRAQSGSHSTEAPSTARQPSSPPSAPPASTPSEAPAVVAKAPPAESGATQPLQRNGAKQIEMDGQTVSGDFHADPKTGALSGNGRVSWTNGDRFSGTLVNGSKEGKGEFVWSNGQRYNGDWVKNQPNGRGTIAYANGNRYEGDVRNGIPSGQGALVFSKGDRYDGEIRNGMPHGRGVMVFADGTRYEGEIRDGLPHGQGTTRFRNGDVYIGTVVRGKSHGQGRFSWANGTAWEGEFRDGQRTANGRMIADAGKSASSGDSRSGGAAAPQ